jgi:hypothetical protein
MRPLRSLLFAPANHARRSEKALSLDADAVILDLEDACPIAEKIATRQLAAAAMTRPRACVGYVRVNPLSTEFGYGDIVAVVGPGVDGIVLPKVESAAELATADWLIAQIERDKGLTVGAIDLLPILETGKGVANASAIASAGTRSKRLAFGAGDFTLDMDLKWSREESELMHYRSSLVLASRASGLEAPLDTVWVICRTGKVWPPRPSESAAWVSRASCASILTRWLSLTRHSVHRLNRSPGRTGWLTHSRPLRPRNRLRSSSTVSSSTTRLCIRRNECWRRTRPLSATSRNSSPSSRKIALFRSLPPCLTASSVIHLSGTLVSCLSGRSMQRDWIEYDVRQISTSYPGGQFAGVQRSGQEDGG